MPKLTSIERQKKNATRFSIYIDNQYAFGISEDVYIAYRKKLEVGKELETDFIEGVLFSEEAQKAFNSAIQLLAFRSRSQKELRTRLKQKGYEDNSINEVMLKLQSYGYIDDNSFARMLAKDKQNIKKLGSRGIANELRQKGIDSDVIREVVEDVCDSELEFENAISLCEKKFRSLQEKDLLQKRKQKVIQFLVRKGYSFDIAKRALDQVLSQ